MEAQREKQRPSNGQLISVPHTDTIRLLEVYVKRSLSLNDGTLWVKRAERKEKWVTKKHRRHSSDPDIHLDDGLVSRDDCAVFVAEPSAVTKPSEPEKPIRKSKKNKKPSFFKSLLGLFSRKTNEDKDEEQDSPAEMPQTFEEDEVSDVATTCLPTAAPVQKKKSMRKKSIKRRFSKKPLKVNKPGNGFESADITGVEGELGE